MSILGSGTWGEKGQDTCQNGSFFKQTMGIYCFHNLNNHCKVKVQKQETATLLKPRNINILEGFKANSWNE